MRFAVGFCIGVGTRSACGGPREDVRCGLFAVGKAGAEFFNFGE